MALKTTDYHIASKTLRRSDKTSEASRLLYITRTGSVIRVSDTLYSQLIRREFESIPSMTLFKLMDMELLVHDAEDEFVTILDRNKHLTNHSDTLQVTVQPTADCQLGCTYCGQTHRKTAMDADLSEKVTQRIIHNINAGNYKKLSVQWFGAEPLMARRAIIEQSKRLIDECERLGVEYNSHIVTNGLSLKLPIFRQLVEQRCTQYQITLDGLPGAHDNTRPTKTGQSTFHLIEKNLIDVVTSPYFSGSGAVILIRMNINKNNSAGVPSLIKRLSEKGLGKRGVCFDFQAVFDWGGNKANIDSYELGDFAKLELEWRSIARAQGFDVQDLLPRRTPRPCMVVDKHGEVYDALGNVFPCYEFPYTEAYDSDEYKIGHIDTISDNQPRTAVTQNWFSDVEGDIAPCKRCNLFPVCGGGCPKTWMNGGIACPPFKANINDRVLLAYLEKHEIHA